MEASERPDWLPDGWGMRVSTRKNGIRDRYYITPEREHTFRSKVEVMRYLTTGKGRTQESERKTHPVRKLEVFPEELPDGWMVEIRTKMTGKTAGQRYKHYIDPVSGYVFRSLKDAFNYIETGEICSRVYKLQENYLGDMYSLGKDSPLPVAANEIKPRGTAVRRCLFSGEEPNANAELIEFSDSPANPGLLLLDFASGQCAGVDGIISSNSTLFNVEHVGERLFNHEIKLLQWPMMGNLAEPSIRTLESEKPSSCGNLQPSVAAETEMELKNEIDCQPVSVDSAKPQRKRGKRRKWRTGNKMGPRKSNVANEVKTRRPKAITMPLRASKRLAGLKADCVAESGIAERSRRKVAEKSDRLRANSINPDSNCRSCSAYGSSNHLPTVPAVNLELPDDLGSQRQTEKLAGTGKWSEDKPISPLTSPFGDSWPDPCLEFAFKTLTGDIPPLEDSVAIQNYFHQQFISVQSASASGPASLILGSSSKLKH